MLALDKFHLLLSRFNTLNCNITYVANDFPCPGYHFCIPSVTELIFGCLGLDLPNGLASFQFFQICQNCIDFLFDTKDF